jgi:hypothetical protein
MIGTRLEYRLKDDDSHTITLHILPTEVIAALSSSWYLPDRCSPLPKKDFSRLKLFNVE